MFDLAHLHQFKANVHVESPHLILDRLKHHMTTVSWSNNLHFNLMRTNRRSLLSCFKSVTCRVFSSLKVLRCSNWATDAQRTASLIQTDIDRSLKRFVLEVRPLPSVSLPPTLRDHRHWQEAQNYELCAFQAFCILDTAKLRVNITRSIKDKY